MSYIEELKELGKLRDDGILSEEEFQKKKEEILSKDSPSPRKEGFLSRRFHEWMVKKYDDRTGLVKKQGEKIQKGYSDIRELKRLKNNGVLTKKEYETQLEELKNTGSITSAYIDFEKASDELDRALRKNAKRRAKRRAGGSDNIKFK